MADREKVIKNLQVVYNYLKSFENTAKMAEWVADALELLKEQENDLRIMFNRCQATAKLLTSGSACNGCIKREKCERLTK